MRDGLYKIEFYTAHGTGGGIAYVIDGRIRGGNSVFAFIGSYTAKGDECLVKVSTQRHTDDPDFKSLFGIDMVTLTLRGTIAENETIELEGTALQVPGVRFNAVLTRICD